MSPNPGNAGDIAEDA